MQRLFTITKENIQKKVKKYFFIYFDGIDESMNLCKVFTKKKAKMYFFFR